MSKHSLKLLWVITVTVLFVYILPASLYAEDKKATKQKIKSYTVKVINSVDELNKVLESSGDRLLMFDLYAGWCMPCKILSPMLETIARENSQKVTVYKINVDKNPDIANALQVTGLPYVLFVKKKQAVHALTGVQPKATYVRAITIFSGMDFNKPAYTPDGKIKEGVRVIKLSTATSPGNLYVYRGEKVKLTIEKVEFPYSVHIPEYEVSQKAEIGKDLSVTFKVNKIGVFPIFCNGKCPSGDGARYGQIIVMQYKSEGKAKYKEIDTDEAAKLIKNSNPLILDVRTPNEYHRGYIRNSKLIPVQQLEGRISEIKEYKDKPVLVYCRSGNRSTVASEILIKHGFKKLYNLKSGIKGWKKTGKSIVK